MKHLNCLTRVPHGAQTDDAGLAAIFSLISDILAAVAVAVTAKESSELPDLTGILGGGGDDGGES